MTKFYTHPYFQELLDWDPIVVRVLLSGLVKEQALRESSALALR